MEIGERTSFGRAKNGKSAEEAGQQRARRHGKFLFFSQLRSPPFIFCALPIFRAAKTRSLADLHRFLGFPFPKNAQERLLRRL